MCPASSSSSSSSVNSQRFQFVLLCFSYTAMLVMLFCSVLQLSCPILSYNIHTFLNCYVYYCISFMLYPIFLSHRILLGPILSYNTHSFLHCFVYHSISFLLYPIFFLSVSYQVLSSHYTVSGFLSSQLKHSYPTSALIQHVCIVSSPIFSLLCVIPMIPFYVVLGSVFQVAFLFLSGFLSNFLPYLSFPFNSSLIAFFSYVLFSSFILPLFSLLGILLLFLSLLLMIQIIPTS